MSARRYHTGCAVWVWDGWLGSFYPERTRQGDMLRRYGERMTAVEGNATFYAVPPESTVARWADNTPESFRFVPKLPRDISHVASLANGTPPTAEFLDRMAGLGPRLGPVLVQLPATYGPANFDDLARFLTDWPRPDVRAALELRAPEWYEEPVWNRLLDLLDRTGTARAILDSRPIHEARVDPDPRIVPARRKPRVPVAFETTVDVVMVRFVGNPTTERHARRLVDWAERVERWLAAGLEVYFFAHCPIEDRSPEIAREFQTFLEERQAAVPPLPWNELGDPPTQLSLFG